uniref:BED-type domain-containing protein n=1 Tax=Latimeria chalumnae TaxID=7897 RepID=H3AY07_LATCH
KEKKNSERGKALRPDPQKKRKQREKRLVNGQFHFKKLADGSVDKKVVTCIYCQAEFQYHRSTSSLQYHLRTKHAFSSQKELSSSSASGSNKKTTKDDHQFCQSTLLEIQERCKPLNQAKYDSITNVIAKWIATNCRPINIVTDTGLRDIIQIASSNQAYTLPSRGTIVSQIDDLYISEKTTKSVLLKDAPFVALTGDYWTSVSNHSYLGITAHLIDAAWTVQSLVLTVKHTEERHYAETCAEHFLDVAKEWDIQDKVTTFGTDNARNMIAAANCLPFEHMPCTAHSLQQSIPIALNAAGFENILAKCRKLVGHFKYSPANSAELEKQQAANGQKQESLIQDDATRWNSTLQMVQNRFAVTATLALQKHNLVVPSAAEFDKLQKLEALLEPCRYVTELLGGETYVSCSVVLPALCHLFRVMAVSDDDPAYVVWFKNSFNADLTKRKESTNLTWLKIATALDPRFKNLKCLPKSERDEVWKLILNLTLSEVSKDQQPGVQEITEAEPPKKKM